MSIKAIHTGAELKSPLKIIPEIETIEWFDDRFYKIVQEDLTPEFYPSVTTVLGIIEKKWLRKWYGDVGTERAQYVSRLAKERGSLIHEAIYNLLEKGYLSNQASIYNQEDWLQIWNFHQWYESLKPQIIQREFIVLSHSHKCAGTLDMLVELQSGSYDTGYSKPVKIESGIYIGDVKTGQMDSIYHYQTAAYAMMCVEMELIPDLQGTFILQTNANTNKGWKMIIREKEQVLDDYECFKAALKLFNSRNEEKPKVFEMPSELKINLR